MKITTIIAFILVLIGAVIWGMVGIFNFNVISLIFGSGSTALVSRIIYSVVGAAAIWMIFVWIAYNPFKTLN